MPSVPVNRLAGTGSDEGEIPKNTGIMKMERFGNTMRTNLKFILPACAGLLAVLLPAFALLFRNDHSANPSIKQTESSASEKPVSLDSPLQAALAATDPASRKELLEQWIKSVDVRRMGDALEQTESISNQELKSEARIALLTSWSARDLAGAVAWFVTRGGADGLHQQACDLLAQAMAGRAPAAMVSWMEQSLSEPIRRELYKPFFKQWTKTDPAAAATLLRQLATSPANSNAANPEWVDLLGQVTAQWARTDVKGAMIWVQTLPEGPAKVQALAQASYSWTEIDPQAAAVYAAQQMDPQLISNVASKWAERDPQAAAFWVRGLPAGEARDSAVASLASVWGQMDPAAAAAYVTSLPPGDAQTKAVAAVASAWASTSPAQAAQWIGQFPEGPVREQAMEGLIESWAANNVNQAAQWLQSLPQGSSRDAAVATFSREATQMDPGAAFQWAETVSDETMRNQQLQDVARFWLTQDPNAAKQAIIQSNLAQDVRSQLLSAATR
jgi:hypothetical protein